MVNQELISTQVEIASPDTQKTLTPSKYDAGRFDVVIGAEPDPELIKDRAYFRGYSDSYWEFCQEKYGIRIPPETTEAARSNYSEGYFDGVVGLEPESELLFTSIAYRSGYQEGIIKFYLKEYQKN